MTLTSLNLTLLPYTLAVCRLPADAPVPGWASTGKLRSITHTADELSIVCLQEAVPKEIKAERDWRALKVDGQLDFGLTGILVAIAKPLAEARISIFALSTFDTDYVLIKESTLSRAMEVLRKAGHIIKI